MATHQDESTWAKSWGRRVLAGTGIVAALLGILGYSLRDTWTDTEQPATVSGIDELLDRRELGTPVRVFVRSSDDGDWGTTATVEPGSTAQLAIEYSNEVKYSIEMTVGLNVGKYSRYLDGTTRAFDTSEPDGQLLESDDIIDGGIDLGSVEPDENGLVVVDLEVDGVNAFEKCGDYTIEQVGVVRGDGGNEVYNSAYLTIPVEC